MPYHRFKIGQVVTTPSIDVPTGSVVIVRLLPCAGGEPRYRVAQPDMDEWELRESQIKPTRAQPMHAGAVRVRPVHARW